MRAVEIAKTHQKLVDDLPTGEAEGLLKQLDPLLARARMMRVEPSGERAVIAAQFLDSARVVDGRGDLEPVTNDPGVGHQPRDVVIAEGGDAIDIETGEGGTK